MLKCWMAAPALFAVALSAQVPVVVPGASPGPTAALTSHERWQRYAAESIFSRTLYLAALGSAAGEQLGNDPPEWRQGAEGYARRSASQLGVLALKVTIAEGTAAALHYEPRYVRAGRSGFLPRMGHAVQWTFLTYDSERHIRFNIPAVASAYGSGMIATAWYPARFSVLHDGVRTGNQQMSLAVGLNVLREFAPELKRIFHLKP